VEVGHCVLVEEGPGFAKLSVGAKIWVWIDENSGGVVNLVVQGGWGEG